MRSNSASLLAVLAVLTALALPPAAVAVEDNPDGSIHGHFQPEDALYKSPVHIRLGPSGNRLFVVCTNTDSVQVVDLTTNEVVREIGVGRRPYDIAFGPEGLRGYVTNSWDDTVSVLDLQGLAPVTTFAAGADPHGIVIDHSGQYLYVTNLEENSLSIIAAADGGTVKKLRTGVKPLELAIAPDGRHVYVSNLLTDPVPFRTPPRGEVTIVDTELQIVVDRRSLPGADICQGLDVSPDGEFVAVALEIPKNLIPETQVYQGWMLTYGLAVLESRPGGRAAILLLDEMDRYYPDPFGVTFSPDGKKLFVTSSGVDTLSVLDVDRMRQVLKAENGLIGLHEETIALYARHLGLSSEYVSTRLATELNPKAVAVSPDGRRVYVANRLSDSVSIIDGTTERVVGTIDLGGPKIVTTVRRGEYVFNHAQISFQQQLSCITCHPENNVDGLLFDIAADGGFGGNLVDNRTLRGVAYTAPFKWSGKNPNLKRQEGPRAAQLFFRSHGFTPSDQDAIVAFIESTPLYPNRHRHPEGLTAAQKRGKEIFERSRTNEGAYIPIGNRCVTCHPPPHHTGRQMNDVGTKAYFDTDGEFDTPQLTGVASTAPYLHDGRCWTLEQIWTLYNPYDLHGVANDLTKQQLNDLIEYLKTL